VKICVGELEKSIEFYLLYMKFVDFFECGVKSTSERGMWRGLFLIKNAGLSKNYLRGGLYCRSERREGQQA